MSKAFDGELLEVAQWYTAHKGDAMSIEARLAFLTKTCDFLIWILAKSAEDIQKLEGRRRNGARVCDPYIMSAVPNNLRTATGHGPN